MGLQEAERGGGLQAMNHGGEMLLPSRAASWRQRPPEYGFCQTNNKVKNAKKDTNFHRTLGPNSISKCPSWLLLPAEVLGFRVMYVNYLLTFGKFIISPNSLRNEAIISIRFKIRSLFISFKWAGILSVCFTISQVPSHSLVHSRYSVTFTDSLEE